MKWFGKYGRKVSWMVKIYGTCGRKVGWIVIRYGKYGRKVSWTVKRYGNYGRNPKLNSEEIWKMWEKSQVEDWKDMAIMEEK